jgi:hypothetical protein
MVKDTLSKVLAHHLQVLIQELHEFGIQMLFWKDTPNVYWPRIVVNGSVP